MPLVSVISDCFHFSIKYHKIFTTFLPHETTLAENRKGKIVNIKWKNDKLFDDVNISLLGSNQLEINPFFHNASIQIILRISNLIWGKQLIKWPLTCVFLCVCFWLAVSYLPQLKVLSLMSTDLNPSWAIFKNVDLTGTPLKQSGFIHM